MIPCPASTRLKVWPYHYDNLEDERSIRCFQLWPGVFEEDLMISLTTSTLELLPTYEAISYVWGNPAERQRVLVMEPDNWTGFGYIEVTKNLCMALKRIRCRETEVCLWADALCIDQGNVLERNQQVRRMADIFGKAKQVLVWLGPDTTGSGEYTFQLARRLAKVNDPARSNASEASPKGKPVAPLAEVLRILGSDGIGMLSSLTHHAWFHRVWTMQELGCSSAATMLVGNASIAWDYLYSAYDLVNHCQCAGSAFVDFPLLAFLYHWKTSNWLGFLNTVLSLESHQTSDPRDRIYALLGHPSAFGTSSDLWPGKFGDDPILQPDYRNSTCEVYFEAARAMILQTGNLDVLSSVQHHDPPANAGSRHRLPSWVPDWDRERTAYHILEKSQSSSRSQGGQALYPIPVIIRSDCRFELHVKGIHCGKVIWHWPAEDADTHNASSSFERLGHGLPHGPGTYLEQSIRGLNRIISLGSNKQAATAATTRALSCCRSTFFTDTSFFGLGPNTVREGDHLYVLHAGRVPYILRKADDGNHALVGECLVKGLMESEVVTQADDAQNLVLV